MGAMLIIMLKGNRQVAHCGYGIGLGHEGDNVPLYFLQDAFRHAVALHTGGVSGLSPISVANVLVRSAI